MTQKLILTKCSIVVNSVDLSDHVSSVQVLMKRDSVETSNFSGGGREHQAGLNDDSYKITFQQDFNAASVDATLYPLYANAVEFTVVVKPTNAAVGVTNPTFTGTCILLDYEPLTGAIGKLSEVVVSMPVQRSGIARATS